MDGNSQVPEGGLDAEARAGLDGQAPGSTVAAEEMMKRLLLACCLFLAVHPAFAEELGGDFDAIKAAAQREGELDMVWSESSLGDAQAAARHEAAFNKLFGTKIPVHFTPGPEFAREGNQLYTEMKAGQPASSDIYIAAAAQVAPLVGRDLFLPVPWPSLGASLAPGRIRPEFSEKDGRVLRIATAVSVVAYNTQLIPNPPASLADLVKPEYQGKLATTPYAAGYDMLAANDIWGPEKALAFVTALSRNVAGLIRCGEMERLASGEFGALVMDCTSQGAMIWKERGAPVDSFIPTEATQRRYTYFTIPRNTRHPNAAALFGLYLLSEPGQFTFWDTMRMDLDALPGSHMAQFIAPYEAKGVKFREVTVDWMASHPEIDQARGQMSKILATSR